jgi:hypothetical protein
MFEVTSNPYKFKYLQTGISGVGIEQVYLPEPPPDNEIHFKKEQRFIRPELDKKIKKAIKILYAKKDPDGDDYDPDYVSPYQTEIDAWINQQYDRFEKGFWFWNNGVRTYLTPMHYAYLTEWVAYFGQPDYRETDKEIAYWWAFIEEDKTSYGGLLNTIRRYGKSAFMGFLIIWRTTRNFSHYSGMQGETDKKIKKFWDLHIIKPFRKMLAYMQPVYDYNSKQSEDIKFERPVTRGKKSKLKLDDEDDFDENEDLESYADYRESSEGAYDSAILHSYIMEEPGKCHPKGTKIRMYDGSIKNVEDVQIGDMLRGTDNDPREVINTGQGRGEIFKIIPNSKSEPWFVNEHHILSCKISGGTPFPGYKKGDVVNINLKTYFNLSPLKKRHLMCYKVGVEYPFKQTMIDPYMLGLWLGDGSSGAAAITNIDPEIIGWLDNKYHIKKYKKQKGKAPIYSIKGNLYSALKDENLIGNKHIPKKYLINSKESRLNLLAGLIDTDGHRCNRKNKPNSRHYEIVQKNKILAEQIKELALSLGFHASINEKIATLNRKGKEQYRCLVYRVFIYGHNLYEIPCRVSRKKMPSNLTTYNSKDPLVYGFKVEYDRVDDYYGFNISGNRLYLLEDYTVTHNTLSANVDDRWSTVKPCLRKGATIRGKALLATTVEHMNVLDKGGKVYQKLFYESDYNKRTGIGQTISGLYAAFLPGDCAFEGFFDDHGHPMRAEARRSIILERESKKHNPKDYSALIRKYPLSTAEIFWVSSEQCVFNATILQERKLELDSSPIPFWSKFDLEWENKKRFSKVIIKHNPENGWYKASWIFAKGEEFEKMANQVRKNSDGTYSPLNEEVFTAGIDPVDHRVVIQSRMGFGEDEFISTRRSKPVMLIKRRYDSSIDGIMGDHDDLAKKAREKYQYKTGVYIGLMDSRPTDPNVMFERALMICWLHGMSMNVESAKPGVMNYFHTHGCADFIKQKYVPESKVRSGYEGEGTPANSATINEYTDCLAWYIDYFGHTMPFVDVVNDLLVFDPANTKVHDYSVAKGWCELGEKIRPKTEKREIINIEDIMPLFDNHGNLLRRRSLN